MRSRTVSPARLHELLGLLRGNTPQDLAERARGSLRRFVEFAARVTGGFHRYVFQPAREFERGDLRILPPVAAPNVFVASPVFSSNAAAADVIVCSTSTCSRARASC